MATRQIRSAHFIGGGIGSLAGAVFLIRDANMDPKQITIYEPLKVNGGSMDGIGTPKGGYVIRGGRMLNLPTYECLQDLMKDIPSIEEKNKTLYDELIEFNKKYKTEGHSRVIDHNRQKYDVRSMTFSMKDRMDLLKLIQTPEDKLGNSRITEHFDPDFFKTNFWYMWSTTFAFQP